MTGKPRILASRRAFLLGASSLLGAGWIGQAMANEPNARTRALFTAWHTARRAGKKLLVVVVPEENARYERGQVLGATLNHGEDAVLAALDTVVLAAATPEELATLGPTTDQDAWFVLVDTVAVPAAFESWAGPSAPGDAPPWGYDHQEAQDRYWNGWIASTSALLTGKLLPTLPDAGTLATMAARARAEIVDKPLAGAHWANSGGCGIRVEDVQMMMVVGCGMGHTPEKARRMLYLYTSGESDWF